MIDARASDTCSFADMVRKEQKTSDEFKMLFGISFAAPDPAACENAFRAPRAPVSHNVVMHT
jgi:hypothetical protein